MARKNFGQYIHDKLAEPEGQQFVQGKFRFWLVAVVFLSVLNAALTSLIFKNDDQENYISPIMLSVGALLAWLCVGCLHYSDSTDRRLARGVAGLDSITLLFVVAHFAGLMYAYGHLQTIRSAERKYDALAAVYNAKAEKVSTDNAKIAEAAREIAAQETKRAKIENDSIYQARKAAEAGAMVQTRRSGAQSIGASLSTSQVQLERPKPPDETSAHFLGEWDWLIRVFNFGELMLAAITLVFIRNQSAKTNSPVEISSPAGDFFVSRRYQSPISTPAFDAAKNDDTVSSKLDDTDAQQKTTRVVNVAGLKRLREALSEIAFAAGKTHFKTDPKPEIGAVWIRQFKSSRGVAREVSSVKARIEILDDAMRISEDKFRAKLERWLRENDFQL